MELDILNDIFSHTVCDLFSYSNKYNIFSQSRNGIQSGSNGNNSINIQGQQFSNKELVFLSNQTSGLQSNQHAYNQQQIPQKPHQLQKHVDQFGNFSINGIGSTINENKKLVSMSLNSSIQSTLLDQNSNQLNTSKDSIQKDGRIGVNKSLNNSLSNKNGSNNDSSLIHSSLNLLSDSTNTIRQSQGQFINNYAQGNFNLQTPQVYLQTNQQNQNYIHVQLNNSFNDKSINSKNSNPIQQNQHQLSNNNSTLNQQTNKQILYQQQTINTQQYQQNNQNLQQTNNGTQNNQGKSNGIQPFVNNFTRSNNNINENIQLTPDDWIKVEAPKKLEESMKRLGLDNQKITQRLIKEMNYEQLQSEKKKVKNELKLYDQAFENYFNVQPTRNQKEPMRPLYVYYKGLKQALSKQQNVNKSHSHHQAQTNSNQGISLNGFSHVNNISNSVQSSLPSSAQVSVQIGMNSHQSSQNDSFDIHNNLNNIQNSQNLNTSYQSSFQNKQNIVQNNSLNTSLNGGLSNPSANAKILQTSNQQQRSTSASNRDFSKNKDLIDQNSYKDIMNIVQEQKENFNNAQAYQQLSIQQPHGSKQISQNNNNSNNVYMNTNSIPYTKDEQNPRIIEQKINFMKRKRVALREQLQVYQDDFYRQHNRKIKYHKDILPVENEYKEYKDIKKEIIKLEQLLQQQQIQQ